MGPWRGIPRKPRTGRRKAAAVDVGGGGEVRKNQEGQDKKVRRKRVRLKGKYRNLCQHPLSGEEKENACDRPGAIRRRLVLGVG